MSNQTGTLYPAPPAHPMQTCSTRHIGFRSLVSITLKPSSALKLSAMMSQNVRLNMVNAWRRARHRMMLTTSRMPFKINKRRQTLDVVDYGEHV